MCENLDEVIYSLNLRLNSIYITLKMIFNSRRRGESGERTIKINFNFYISDYNHSEAEQVLVREEFGPHKTTRCS